MSRPNCPDCGKPDQMHYGPNVSRTRFFIGCVRCQNAKDYPSFPDMWSAWCDLIEAQAAQPTQAALFEAAS